MASELVRQHPAASRDGFKRASGEHLAAILTSACLNRTPVGIDLHGSVDLTYDLTDPPTPVPEAFGLRDASHATFEVKSLPGKFREFDAAIDRAIAAGVEPVQKTFRAKVVSVNDVLSGVGSDVIQRAKRQLEQKAPIGYSRNIFLVAHYLEYPAVEVYADEIPLIAHRLAPLSGLDGIDSVWTLWSPHPILVIWSTRDQRWVNVCFAYEEGEGQDDPEEFPLLQQVEAEFMESAGGRGSPFYFGMTAGDGPAP
ncbi:hypothetical protein SAMN04488563_5392 [Jiangella alkaliphila]|uniref:Uncharacterized protein n=2 Tax=Jiangella alkaliphila TaxID=419479 RepID=A0A1H2L8V7_9ACTN|nr:hypothetical protein SAMN04488563_5392 [Jiangella alkaliphila]